MKNKFHIEENSGQIKYQIDTKLELIANLCRKYSKLDNDDRPKEFAKDIQNQEIFEAIKYICEPMNVLGITSQTGTSQDYSAMINHLSLCNTEVELYTDFIEMTKIISSGVSVEDRYAMMRIYRKANSANYDIIDRIGKKHLELGLTFNTMNNIMGGAMKPMNIVQRRTIDAQALKIINFTGYHLAEDIYGIRFYAIFNKYGEPFFFSEDNMISLSLWRIINTFKFAYKHNPIKDKVIVGSVYRLQDNLINSDIENSNPNEFMGFHKRHYTAEGNLMFLMHDMFTLEEFQNGKSNKSYSVRIAELEALEKESVSTIPMFRVAKHEVIQSNEWLIDKLRNDTKYDGFSLYSENPYDCTKIQEYNAIKRTAKIKIIESYFSDGIWFVKDSSGAEYILSLGMSEYEKSIIAQTHTELINKEIEIMDFGADGSYTKPKKASITKVRYLPMIPTKNS